MVQQGTNLVLPGSTGGYTSLPGSWSSYSARNREDLMAKMQSMEALRPNDEPLTIDYIWNGDGDNKNSALTVFRHRDSASVVQGFVGEPPKIAWLINPGHLFSLKGTLKFGSWGAENGTQRTHSFRSQYSQSITREAQVL